MVTLKHWLAVAVVAVLASLTLSTAGAQTQDDVDEARERQERIRAEAEDAAGDIDVLEAEVTDLLAAIDALQANVELTTTQLIDAEQNLAASELALASVTTRIDELETARASARAALRTTAIEQYVDGGADSGSAIFSAREPLAATLRQRLYEVAGGSVSELLEELRALDAQLVTEQAAAVTLVDQAEADRAQTADLVVANENALALQEQISSQVEGRLASRLAEADALAAIDQQLSAEIQAGEQALAAEAARIAAARQAEAAAAAAAAAANNPGTSDSGNGSGSGSGGDSGSSPSAPADPSVAPRTDRSVPTPPLRTVRGITVNVSIAGQLDRMLAAAEADGIALGGGGYRNSDAQIRLRVANCGNTDYLIWDAPANACSPPTARPGESNHEKGLAVDFTHNGGAIRSRSSAAFQWLAANAGSYGFRNLPSEPWHWSVNGN